MIATATEAAKRQQVNTRATTAKSISSTAVANVGAAALTAAVKAKQQLSLLQQPVPTALIAAAVAA